MNKLAVLSAEECTGELCTPMYTLPFLINDSSSYAASSVDFSESARVDDELTTNLAQKNEQQKEGM